MACDSKTFYTASALLYVGKGTHDDQIPLGVYLIKEIAK
jgi:hypothetical protein